jgi:hypothetical protein
MALTGKGIEVEVSPRRGHATESKAHAPGLEA